MTLFELFLHFSCGAHKCSSPCHSGLCYPCPLQATVTCFCGRTAISVPCGREKKTRPPKCSKPCTIPPDCHHPTRMKHPCHFGRCPPCAHVCSKTFPHCEHFCPVVCHSAVLMDVNQMNNKRAAGPWEKLEPKLELVNLPCPPCKAPVPVECLGRHEISHFPCSEARPYSCGRICGQKLPCGNHICQKVRFSIGSMSSSLHSMSQVFSNVTLWIKQFPPVRNAMVPVNCPDLLDALINALR